MEYGTNVWYGHTRNTRWQYILEKLSELGFNYIELGLDYPLIQNLGINPKELKSLLDSYNLGIAFHGPHAGVELAHPNRELAEGSLKLYRKAIELASKFDPEYFNFHISAHPATFKFKEVKEKILNRAVSSASTIAKLANKYGIPVTIENDPSLFIGLPKQFDYIFSRVNELGFCFDNGHAMISRSILEKPGMEDFKDQTPLTSLESWIEKFKNRIQVVHLHDYNVKNNQDHLPFGGGNIDMKKLCKQIASIPGHKYTNIEVYYGFIPKKSLMGLERSLKSCKAYLEKG